MEWPTAGQRLAGGPDGAGRQHRILPGVLRTRQRAPFFAPIAAVISLSLTLGQRGRRAPEVVFGVAVGLIVADLLVLAIGVGTL